MENWESCVGKPKNPPYSEYKISCFKNGEIEADLGITKRVFTAEIQNLFPVSENEFIANMRDPGQAVGKVFLINKDGVINPSFNFAWKTRISGALRLKNGKYLFSDVSSYADASRKTSLVVAETDGSVCGECQKDYLDFIVKKLQLSHEPPGSSLPHSKIKAIDQNSFYYFLSNINENPSVNYVLKFKSDFTLDPTFSTVVIGKRWAERINDYDSVNVFPSGTLNLMSDEHSDHRLPRFFDSFGNQIVTAWMKNNFGSRDYWGYSEKSQDLVLYDWGAKKWRVGSDLANNVADPLHLYTLFDFVAFKDGGALVTPNRSAYEGICSDDPLRGHNIDYRPLIVLDDNLKIREDLTLKFDPRPHISEDLSGYIGENLFAGTRIKFISDEDLKVPEHQSKITVSTTTPENQFVSCQFDGGIVLFGTIPGGGQNPYYGAKCYGGSSAMKIEYEGSGNTSSYTFLFGDKHKVKVPLPKSPVEGAKVLVNIHTPYLTAVELTLRKVSTFAPAMNLSYANTAGTATFEQRVERYLANDKQYDFEVKYVLNGKSTVTLKARPDGILGVMCGLAFKPVGTFAGNNIRLTKGAFLGSPCPNPSIEPVFEGFILSDLSKITLGSGEILLRK